MCFDTTCVHIYSISLHDPLEFEIDVIDLIISILSHFFSSSFISYFSIERGKLFELREKRRNDCLRIFDNYAIFMSILMHNHIDSFSLCQYQQMKKKMNCVSFYKFLPIYASDAIEKSEQDYCVVTTACSRCFLIYIKFFFCVSVMNRIYIQYTLTQYTQYIQKHVFLRKFMSSKNHLY